MTATGGSGNNGSGNSGGSGTGNMPLPPPTEGSHPLYPALDLDELPGDGGGSLGAYRAPALPNTADSITISGSGEEAGRAIVDACRDGGVTIDVPNSAGRLGNLTIGGTADCDITFGPNVILDALTLGLWPGEGTSPVQRIRIRGGQFGGLTLGGTSTDVVFDGVVINTGLNPPESRTPVAVGFGGEMGALSQRIALINSVIRTEEVETAPGTFDGAAFIGLGQDVLFANNNVASSGNHNSWGFRISGGGNFLFVDNVVRVSFHKLVRMNDHDVDYVYIKGGTWMREERVSDLGAEASDTWAQLSDDRFVDNVYIHDTTAYLLPRMPPSFGPRMTSLQVGRIWEARRIHWFVRDENVMSDQVMAEIETYCVEGALCDYGVGTHEYSYDENIQLPTDAWHDLPGIESDNPDALQ
jgi:hypothetical protein